MDKDNKTAWEKAAASEGTTESERLLTRLARKAFLTLWSHPNLFTDEGRSRGKGDGKELCDLLVVFGNNVLLFSDKHCEFPTHPDLKIAWPRWYKRAIEKSSRQLAGAEKFIKAHPTRLFLDKACQSSFPIDLPDPDIARYFLIAVTRGSKKAAEQHWGGGSSGSLMLDTTIEGERHYTRPFTVGFPLSNRRFVHVLDELTVDILLEELDTVPDLIAYLECKEAYLTQSGIAVWAAGEEQLLARYMFTMKDGRHGLPAVPPGSSGVALQEGDWEYYSESVERKAKKAADAPSYMWDHLIEYQSSFIRAGTAISLPETDTTAADHERIVRAIADESRLSRRLLTSHLQHALLQNFPGKRFTRVVVSMDQDKRAYVFLTIPKPPEYTYEKYREMRTATLLTYCHGIKLKLGFVLEAIGIASEPLAESLSSQDFLYVDLKNAPSPEEKTLWEESMEELEILQAPTIQAFRKKDHEFPIPFSFKKAAEFRSASDGMPMNRAARRAMAKDARRKK